MPTVIIPLEELVVDPEHNPEPTGLTEVALREYYSFLGQGAEITVQGDELQITVRESSGYQRDQALRSYERAVKSGERASHRRVIRLLREVLDVLPTHTHARRNLAMAHLESGDPETARELLVQTLRLDPHDAWAYVLLGNIIAKEDGNLELAEELYERAAELAPRDPLVIANYGAVLGRQGRTQEAYDLFLRAIEMEPTYPRSYYGLAKIAYDEGDPERAVTVLDNMFDIAEGATARDQEFFDQARAMYLEANKQIAQERSDELMALVQQRADEIEALSGYPVELVQENDLAVPATTQVAWNYGRDHHLLRYTGEDMVTTPHLLIHELEHIAMQVEARKAGRNRTFVGTSAADRAARRAIESHARDLRRHGMSDAFLDEWLPRTIDVIRSQLYNIPLDMIIEQRLYERYERLHPSQFVSLHQQHLDALPALTDEHLRETAPPVIYRATVSLNHAFALLIDHLYGERTDYAVSYKREAAAANGPRIFNLWQRTMRGYSPGDEYRFVDEVAELLGLERWFEWRVDEAPRPTRAEEEKPSGPTDLEALERREPAVVMYMLDALERFEGMSGEQVFQIGSEIALMGQGGLDYTSPEEQYTLRTLPDERFSGLQLLSLMYVAFQQVNPSLDLHLPFEEAYRQALRMFTKGSGNLAG